jgi:hypothetical protein
MNVQTDEEPTSPNADYVFRILFFPER